jgi:hypothetical protein
MEFGKQGTVDVYSTNSINLRTQGTLNLHADKNINMYAGGSIRMKAKGRMALESESTMTLNSQKSMLVYSKETLGIRADGTLALKGKQSTWAGGKKLNLKATIINLNGAPAANVPVVQPLNDYSLADTKFNKTTGWTVEAGKLKTIVTRAPTHEPYPYHGKGVDNTTDLNSTPEAQDPVAQLTSSVSGNSNNLLNKSAGVLPAVAKTPLINPINVGDYLKQIPASDFISKTTIPAGRIT